jgi:hypothetical protein
MQLLHPTHLECHQQAFSHSSGRGSFHSLLTGKVSGRKYTDIQCSTLNCHKFRDMRFVFESPPYLRIFPGRLFCLSRLWTAIKRV